MINNFNVVITQINVAVTLARTSHRTKLHFNNLYLVLSMSYNKNLFINTTKLLKYNSIHTKLNLNN